MSGLLVAGTNSDAGKSVVTSGLCRAFARRGISVAPFKAQNMSNNSMVVGRPAAAGGAGGLEIGRAQWVQARAARIPAEVDMNPVLLKPGTDLSSHLIVLGRPAGEVAGHQFAGERGDLAAIAHAAFDRLADRFDLVVAEGAGSPAEINLRRGDFVNMGLARHADLPVLVVGDIDRGGVFASMFGTLALLEPEDQRLIAGWLVNRFRGDRGLLAPGLERLATLTGRPVLGVLPWHQELWLDSEDALDLEGRRSAASGSLRVAVLRLPRISNFTDLDALGLEPDLDVVFASTPRGVADADLVVLPGTRSTLADLDWMRARGLDRAVVEHARAGRPVLGICGGYQMLGREILDVEGVEAAPGSRVPGLGLLPVRTEFAREKVVRLIEATALGVAAGGYEIHHGRVRVEGGVAFGEGCREGAVFGTLWHGVFEGDALRGAFLAEVADALGSRRSASAVRFEAARERRLDLLGDLVEEHCDLDRILELAGGGSGAGRERPVLEVGTSALTGTGPNGVR